MNETVNSPVCRETFCTKQDVSLSIYLEMNTTRGLSTLTILSHHRRSRPIV
jgi:hypothetical protein